MSKIKENKEQFWLEKFDCFSVTGKDSKRFLNGITTGNIVDLNNKVLKSCWLSPNGILKSLLIQKGGTRCPIGKNDYRILDYYGFGFW